VTHYLIVGQGNPGREHANQRHNLGFWCIDAIAKRHDIKMRGPRFWEKNLADVGMGTIDGADVTLLKPQTYYNGTGRAVARYLRQKQIPVENLIVIYDDLDLPEGRIRLRPKGSHGGNNGLKSIASSLGSTDFGRIRVGVGRPWANQMPSWDQDVVVEYLLSAPPQAARQALEAAAERVGDAVEAIIRDGWERAMDTFNRTEPGETAKA
jgi:peptidyl-tRNA hydrolase, PTH1 family